MSPDDALARDLGLDSLARVDLLMWLEEEFGFPRGEPEAVVTVGDVMLAACGEAVGAASRGYEGGPARRGSMCAPRAHGRSRGATIPEAFLAQAEARPDKVVTADQARGVRTYRDLVTAILVLNAR